MKLKNVIYNRVCLYSIFVFLFSFALVNFSKAETILHFSTQQDYWDTANETAQSLGYSFATESDLNTYIADLTLDTNYWVSDNSSEFNANYCWTTDNVYLSCSSDDKYTLKYYLMLETVSETLNNPVTLTLLYGAPNYAQFYHVHQDGRSVDSDLGFQADINNTTSADIYIQTIESNVSFDFFNSSNEQATSQNYKINVSCVFDTRTYSFPTAEWVTENCYKDLSTSTVSTSTAVTSVDFNNLINVLFYGFALFFLIYGFSVFHKVSHK